MPGGEVGSGGFAVKMRSVVNVIVDLTFETLGVKIGDFSYAVVRGKTVFYDLVLVARAYRLGYKKRCVFSDQQQGHGRASQEDALFNMFNMPPRISPFRRLMSVVVVVVVFTKF